ncbi:hypothetical protein [Paenibacillus sp. MZ03-122A]|uniref:hypothetical protein n=1 Tax=Paenibacillus sp. MZ03-122A TaxID=2962033 RepID=UPI0020B8EF81|nr:hypothetical protein [Paenibacillus sp. MZ03-122A]MCP3780429.1 hypothetical protein [Paenibacillus sp. MZ03-122A]
MSGGFIARQGFRFQDLFLLSKVLEHIAAGDEQHRDEMVFGIESPRPDSDEKDWDVLILQEETQQVMEVKRGAINKDDRRDFWLSIRAELIQAGDRHEQVIPILVTNAENEPAVINEWRELSNLQDINPRYQGVEVSRVDNVDQLIQQALYWLTVATHSDNQSKTPLGNQIEHSIAIQALNRFRLKEVQESELVNQIEDKLGYLAYGPDPHSLLKQLEGFINQKATTENEVKRCFTISELVREVQLLDIYLHQDPEAIRLIRKIIDELTSVCIGGWRHQFEGAHGMTRQEISIVQPALVPITRSSEKFNQILLGEAGQGKSYSLFQIYNEFASRVEQYRVYPPLQADSIVADIEANTSRVQQAFRIICGLAALQGQYSLFLIDSLDHLPKDKRDIIGDLLRTCGEHSRFCAIVSCRQVDWDDTPVLKERLERWSKVHLEQWNANLVRRVISKAGIEREITPSIVTFLQIPLYLDLFLRTFARGLDEDVPDTFLYKAWFTS